MEQAAVQVKQGQTDLAHLGNSELVDGLLVAVVAHPQGFMQQGQRLLCSAESAVIHFKERGRPRRNVKRGILKEWEKYISRATEQELMTQSTVSTPHDNDALLRSVQWAKIMATVMIQQVHKQPTPCVKSSKQTEHLKAAGSWKTKHTLHHPNQIKYFLGGQIGVLAPYVAYIRAKTSSPLHVDPLTTPQNRPLLRIATSTGIGPRNCQALSTAVRPQQQPLPPPTIISSRCCAGSVIELASAFSSSAYPHLRSCFLVAT
eukprot:scaffold264232_cov20-Tisochrysis_lutea.AAC.1